ncbi:monosaccharide ABC transporter ATP-binding protein (CUT2 family) [Ancylobacter aquaticus]|uniref:Monosaccharide ABC transporter ATP-binding protein (CUT2 family) n=1 Tax=Ancylobacter aquaticus TaxID=100 RepID=A0A4R1I559_ANCAQ|nr:ATP-binding cassette domain-containing protein [Ancylobacter aquaticus]TCK29171.1 monosaccharide ABC transporter ATP-binding protein (CUT2 family) [Ancylobacter aquaticus]
MLRENNGALAPRPRVDMRGITKTYGPIRSLRGVDLSLAPGEVLGLVGDNGAGKSTLTKVLSGAVTPDGGTISIDGEEVRFNNPADARRKRIEMVYQDLSLCDTVDVAGNLFMGRELTRSFAGIPLLAHDAMHERARIMLQGLGIRIPDTHALVGNLSGGQRQAIAISRAISFEPLVLIMDEPTAALAVAEVEAVLEIIRNVSKMGVSVILVTHRLQDLFLVCNRIMVMYEGTNVATPEVASTSLSEIVELIVGHKFEAASARA